MNELSDELKPYRSFIDNMTKELGYDPSEGCKTWKEVIEKLPKDRLKLMDIHCTEKIDIKKNDIIVFDAKPINPNDLKSFEEENRKKQDEIIEPNASIIVNDETNKKRRTYIPPVPTIDFDEIKKMNQELIEDRKAMRENKQKPKTNIISNLINKFIK